MSDNTNTNTNTNININTTNNVDEELEHFNIFWIELENGCHKWTGVHNDQGYGYYNYYDELRQVRTRGAHRWIFKKTYGFVPPVVMQNCNRKDCVNIDHLVPGTYHEKNLKMMMRGRNRTKLVADDVHSIRQWWEDGRYNFNEMAAIFDVAASTIARAATRRTWKHI